MRQFLELTASNGNPVFIDATEIICLAKHTDKASAIFLSGVPTAIQVNIPVGDLVERLKLMGLLTTVKS